MRKTIWMPFLLLLLVTFGCTDKEATEKNGNDKQTIAELEKRIETLKNENEKLVKKEEYHVKESLSFSEISRLTSLFMEALEETNVDTIVALSDENVPLFVKNDDIWTTTEDDVDLNLTYNESKQILKNWFIEYIELDPNDNRMIVLVRPQFVDEKGETVQEADRYYHLIFSNKDDKWQLTKITK